MLVPSATSTSIDTNITTIDLQDETLNPISIDNNNIITITFSNIGEYDFTFNYVINNLEYNSATKNYTSTYIINSQLSDGYDDQTNPTTFVKQDNWKMVGDVKLYIFGYQLFYSDYSSEVSNNKEFRNPDYITDVTFLNDTTTKTNSDPATISTFDKNKSENNLKVAPKLASTNQAPVTLSYYANMTLDGNATKSYYKYWTSYKNYQDYLLQYDAYLKELETNPTYEKPESLKKLEPKTFSHITNNTRFTQNGYYQVYIEYNFANYKQWVLHTNESGEVIKEDFNDKANEIKHYQFFSFAINNSEPKIDVKDEEDKMVSTNGYTNKGVSIHWSANSDFDIAPRVKILRQSFEDLANGQGEGWTTVYDASHNGSNYGIVVENENTIKIVKPTDINGIDVNGYYQVIINYGPGSHTIAKYRFYIDYQKISGITSYAIINQENVKENEKVYYKVELDNDKTNSNILNSAFMLDWNPKLSGAEITASYDFIALNKNDGLLEKNKDLLPDLTTHTTAEDITAALNGTILNLFNGYEFSSIINKNVPYSKAVIEPVNLNGTISDTLTDINSMRTSAGFYIFTLKDSAGNIDHKVVLVDDTKSQVYAFINEQEENEYSNVTNKKIIASRDSIIIWGNNKAIKVPTEVSDIIKNEEYSEYFNGYDLAEISVQINDTDTINYSTLLISTDQVQINDESRVENQYYDNEHKPSEPNHQLFFIKYTDTQRSEIDAAVKEDNTTKLQTLLNKYFNYGEHIHNINIKSFNYSDKTKDSNKVFNNVANVSLEMNGDNSLLMAYVDDNRLYNAEVANGSKLKLDWVQNEGNEFEVKDITVYYYPLNFDESSANYPYSATPMSQTKIDLVTSEQSSINANKLMSNAINLESGSSLEGMYLVRREYVNPLSIEDENNISGDFSPRYHLFFIDRNKVISYTSGLQLIGEEIGLKIGTSNAYHYGSNYQVEFSGSDFLIDANENNIKFRTSKLPIKWLNEISSLNKFTTADNAFTELDTEDNLKLNGEDTSYSIHNQLVKTFELLEAKIEYKERQTDAFEPLKTLGFTKNGYYKVTLSDKTANGKDENNQPTRVSSANDFTFIFQVAVETPRANVAKYIFNDSVNKNEYLFYTEGQQNISTNQKNMIVAWNKPVSESGLDAEIDLYNFTVKAKFENGKIVNFNVINGGLTSNITIPRTSKLEITDISTEENKNASKFVNPTFDYYLDFDDIYKILPDEYKNLSANFEITLQYVGDEEDYAGLTDVRPNKFFYTIKNIVFDFNKPEYNYNRLISSDLYLTNFYDVNSTESYKNFVKEFSNYNSQVNFENYAFTVDKNFTIDQMKLLENSIFTDSNMDTYKMFIRKYNKYQDETIANQQSIVPDDDRYDNRALFPNRYRFDENYQIDGNKLYTNISELYWNDSEHRDYTLEYIINSFGGEYNTYYEIIEIDFAGNYRVYTIYVKEDLNSSISSANFNGKDTSSELSIDYKKNFNSSTRYTVDNKQVNLVSASEQLQKLNNASYERIFAKQLTLTELQDLSSNFINKYLTVTINNITANLITTLTYSPNEDLNEFIRNISQLISAYNEQTGNIYYLTFTSSFGETLKIEHRKPSSAYPNYSIYDTSTGFTLQFSVSVNDVNSSSYFTEFNAYQAQNGVISEQPLERDSTGAVINSDIEEYLKENAIDTYTFRYTFNMRGSSGSEYFLKLTDNFGRQLTIRKIIGLEDNKDKIVYSSASENVLQLDAFERNGSTLTPIKINYTNADATLRYQNILYTLKVYNASINKVGEDYILAQGDEVVLTEGHFNKNINGIWTYPLINRDTANDSIFKVVFTSTQGDEIYYVGYHNSLGKINIINASTNSKTKVTPNLSVTYDKTILININNTGELFPTIVSGVREYVDSNNQVVRVLLGNVASGEVINQIGTYTFTAYNGLGTTLTFTVKIEEKIITNYWVNYFINGIEAGRLTPAKQDKTNLSEYGSLNNPISYFTIYDYEIGTNTSNGYNYQEVVGAEVTEKYNGSIVGTTKVYKTYRLVNEEIKDEVYISISKVVANSNFVKNYGNNLSINGKLQTSNEAKVTPNTETNLKTALLELAHNYNILSQNSIILRYYFNGRFAKELYLNEATEVDLTFIDGGVYDFYFTDLAGNRQMFGNNSYFRMYLLNDIIFNVNSNQAIDNSIFNGSVRISLEQVQQFDNAQVNITAKRNGREIRVSKVNNTFTFEEFGLYNITLSGKINGNAVVTDFSFRIININEAMTTFEYVGLNNYEIVKVVKLETKDSVKGDDITNYLKDSYGNVSNLSSIALSTLENGVGGSGIYEIQVQARYNTSKLDQEFSFKVWLNNDNEVLIKSSINYGDGTTKPIKLTLNKNQIYNKIGECSIYFNDTEWIKINSETAKENISESYTISENGAYNIRIVTKSGNTLSSFVIYKNEPLNAVAIIVIVISVIAVGVVVFIFIRLRKNMKVK